MNKFDMGKLGDARSYARNIICKMVDDKINVTLPLNEMVVDEDINKFQLGIFVENCMASIENSVFLKPYDNDLFNSVIDVLENHPNNTVVPYLPIFKYRSKSGDIEVGSVEPLTLDAIEKAIGDDKNVAIYKFQDNVIIGKILK